LTMDDLSFRKRFTVEDLSMRPSAPTALGPTLGELMPTPSGFLTASSTGEEVLLKILKFDCYITKSFENRSLVNKINLPGPMIEPNLQKHYLWSGRVLHRVSARGRFTYRCAPRVHPTQTCQDRVNLLPQ
jgi:hypothetical protein